jgi:hypothetical protein
MSSTIQNDRKAAPLADMPYTKFSRRGFLKSASATAATTVIESASALARETKGSLHHAGQSVPTHSPSSCSLTDMRMQ